MHISAYMTQSESIMKFVHHGLCRHTLHPIFQAATQQQAPVSSTHLPLDEVAA